MNNYFIRRISSQKNKKYTHKYYDKNDNIITYNSIKEHLEGFYIPPAYDDVQINKNKKAKILAIGYDDKDRPQYIYNKKHTEKQSKKKFEKLIEFGHNYKKIYNKINKDLNSKENTKNKEIAMILKIIIDCNFRIGNDKYTKDNNSYGVSTLEKKHILERNGNIIINFIGKKGVENECIVRDKKIVRSLKNKKSQKKKRIFSYKKNNKNYNIQSKDVNKYLKDLGDFTTKNFRTWNANLELIKELLYFNEDEKYVMKKCIENVAFKLHHTASICKKNYLNPRLIEFYNDYPDEFLQFFYAPKTKNIDIIISKKLTEFLEDNY
tara:strand:+ start:898 stop:1863 length:966 start_codon:yes stop_codon:yes gene_type:complete